MGETDLQRGGGYIYQWECAILLALNYFFEPLRYNLTQAAARVAELEQEIDERVAALYGL